MRAAAAAFIRWLKDHAVGRNYGRRDVFGNLLIECRNQLVDTRGVLDRGCIACTKFLVGPFAQQLGPIRWLGGKESVEVDRCRRAV